MSRRARIIAALICGICSFAACLAYGRHTKAQAERTRLDALERYGGEVVSLLVATRTLEYGDVIDAGAVAPREWLLDLAPEQALVRLEDAIGQKVTVPLAKGVPLTQLNLRDGASGIEVPAGFVSLSLPMSDKLALSKNVTAGTRVVAYSAGASSTALLTADALVLAVPTEATSFSTSQSVSLAVRPNDVNAVLTASARGDLRLVVPADDVEFEQTAAPAAPTEVLPEAAPPAAEKPAEETSGAEAAAQEGAAQEGDAGAENDQDAARDEQAAHTDAQAAAEGAAEEGEEG